MPKAFFNYESIKQNKDLVILSYLRSDARAQLKEISRKTGIPISTIHEKLKKFQKNYIKKFTCVLNYELLGYNALIKVLIKTKKSDKERLAEYLKKQLCVNSLVKVNNGYDFLLEAIFENLHHAEHFLEKMEQSFTIRKKAVFYVIDKLKEENFLTSLF